MKVKREDRKVSDDDELYELVQLPIVDDAELECVNHSLSEVVCMGPATSVALARTSGTSPGREDISDRTNIPSRPVGSLECSSAVG